MTDQCQRIINTPAEYNNLLRKLTKADVNKDGKIKPEDNESLYVTVKDDQTQKRLAIQTNDASVVKAYAQFFKDNDNTFKCVIDDQAIFNEAKPKDKKNFAFALNAIKALRHYKEGKALTKNKALKKAFKQDVDSGMVVPLLHQIIRAHLAQGKKIDKPFLNALAKAMADSPHADILLAEIFVYITPSNLSDFAGAVDIVYKKTSDKANTFLQTHVVNSENFGPQKNLVYEAVKTKNKPLKKAFSDQFDATAFLNRVMQALDQNDFESAQAILTEYQEALDIQVILEFNLDEKDSISDSQRVTYLKLRRQSDLVEHAELQLLTALTPFKITFNANVSLDDKVRKIVALIKSVRRQATRNLYQQSLHYTDKAIRLVEIAKELNIDLPHQLAAECAYYGSLFYAVHSDTSHQPKARQLFSQAANYSPNLNQETEYKTRLGMLSGILGITDPDLHTDSLFTKARRSLVSVSGKPEDKEGLYLAWILSNFWQILASGSYRNVVNNLNQIQILVNEMGEDNLSSTWVRFRKAALEEYIPNGELVELARHFQEPANLFFNRAALNKFEDRQTNLDLRAGQKEIAERLEKKLDDLGESLEKSLDQLKESSDELKKSNRSLSAEFAESLFKLFFEQHFKGALGHLEDLMLAVFEEAQEGNVKGFLTRFQAMFLEALKIPAKKLPFLDQLKEMKLFENTLAFLKSDEAKEALEKSPDEFMNQFRKKITEDVRAFRGNHPDIASPMVHQLALRVQDTHPDLASYLFILARFVKDQDVKEILPDIITTFGSQVASRFFNIEDVLPEDLKVIISNSRKWLETIKKIDWNDPAHLARLSNELGAILLAQNGPLTGSFGNWTYINPRLALSEAKQLLENNLAAIGLIPPGTTLKQAIKIIRGQIASIIELVDMTEIKKALARGDKDVWIRADGLLKAVDAKLAILGVLPFIQNNDKTKKAISHSRQAIQMARLILSPFIPGSDAHKQVVCLITRIQNVVDKTDATLHKKLTELIPLVADFLANPDDVTKARALAQWFKANSIISSDLTSDINGLQKQIAKALGYKDWSAFKNEFKDLVGKNVQFKKLAEVIQKGNTAAISILDGLNNLTRLVINIIEKIRTLPLDQYQTIATEIYQTLKDLAINPQDQSKINALIRLMQRYGVIPSTETSKKILAEKLGFKDWNHFITTIATMKKIGEDTFKRAFLAEALVSRYAPDLWKNLKATIGNIKKPSLDLLSITHSVDDFIDIINSFVSNPNEQGLQSLAAILTLFHRIKLEDALTALEDVENAQTDAEKQQALADLYKLCLEGLNLDQMRKEEIEEFAEKLKEGFGKIKEVSSTVRLTHQVVQSIKIKVKDWEKLTLKEALAKIDTILTTFLKTDFDSQSSIKKLAKTVLVDELKLLKDSDLNNINKINKHLKTVFGVQGDASKVAAQLKKIQDRLKDHENAIELARSIVKAYQSFYVTLKSSDLEAVFKRFAEKNFSNYFAYKYISGATYKGNIINSVNALNPLLKLVGIAEITIPPDSYTTPEGIANTLIDRLLQLAERLDLLKEKELASVREKWRELQDDWTKTKYNDLLESLDPAIKNLHKKYEDLKTAQKEVLNLLRFRDGQISPDLIELSVSGANIVHQAVAAHPQMDPEFRHILNGIEVALRLVPAVDIVKELEVHFKAMKKDVAGFVSFIKSFDIRLGNWSEFRERLVYYKSLLLNHLANVTTVLEKIKKQAESLNLKKVDVVAYIEKVQNVISIIDNSFDQIDKLSRKAQRGLVDRMSGAAVEVQFRKLKTGQTDEQGTEITRDDAHFQARFDFLIAGDPWKNVDAAAVYLPLRLQLGEGFFGGAEVGLGGRINILGRTGAEDYWWLNWAARASRHFDVGLMASASLYAEEIDPTGNGPRELSAGFRPRLGAYLDWSMAGVAKARLGAGWVGNVELTGQDRFVETNKNLNLWLGISRPH